MSVHIEDICYLTGEHGTEIITAGCQHDAVGWEICALHPQSDIAQRVAFSQGVHGIQDGFGMRIGHDVLRRHDDRGWGGVAKPQALQDDDFCRTQPISEQHN